MPNGCGKRSPPRTSNEIPMPGRAAPITRRDFLNGIPLTVSAAAAAGLLPGSIAAAFAAAQAPQDAPGYYPPALAGLRGSHPGAYEAAHRLRDGDFWSQPPPYPPPQAGEGREGAQTDEIYDL